MGLRLCRILLATCAPLLASACASSPRPVAVEPYDLQVPISKDRLVEITVPKGWSAVSRAEGPLVTVELRRPADGGAVFLMSFVDGPPLGEQQDEMAEALLILTPMKMAAETRSTESKLLVVEDPLDTGRGWHFCARDKRSPLPAREFRFMCSGFFFLDRLRAVATVLHATESATVRDEAFAILRRARVRVR